MLYIPVYVFQHDWSTNEIELFSIRLEKGELFKNYKNDEKKSFDKDVTAGISIDIRRKDKSRFSKNILVV